MLGIGRRREDTSSSTGDSVALGQDDEPQIEYIIKEMYVPPAQESTSTDQQEIVDLVFVHGLGGNLRTTWKQVGTTEPWFTKPEFLGRLQGSVRALSFGYNANRFGDVANTRIIHHANDLLRNLVLKRLDNPDRPLIFIAHSLGGLVVKRAILLCATNDDWKAIKQSTKSIIFMGTPHMGSEKAEDLVVVQKMASLMKLQAPIATNLTKELRIFSTAVQDINMEFTIDVHRSIKLLCCYESHPQRLPSGTKEIIVPQWSAVLQGVANIDLNCTHSALSKFSSPTEPRFEIFWGEVHRLVKLATVPPIKPIKKAPTWTDEEISQPTPTRQQQVAPPRRRHEVSQKGLRPSRASIIRSSANEILKEVRSRMPAEAPVQHETTISQAQPHEQLEKLDPGEFGDFLRQLRAITPENKGFDREQPHWQTCSWILEDPTFVDWKESEEGGLLFVTGSPGCGKSNLAKYIQGIMEKPSSEDADEKLVVSFYCDSLESSRQNPPVLDLVVKSLLGKQRSISQAASKKLHSLLEALYPDRQKMRPSQETESGVRFVHLMEIVQCLVMDENGIPACLIIDGLDQCEDDFILRLLRGLDTIFRRQGSSTTLKVVITSRMADSIRGFALANTHIEITPELVVDDIQRVVDEEVDRIIVSRQIATIGRSSVSAVIVERSNGSFLFASSVLKELWYIKDTGANSVFTLVTSCPSTMEAIYQQDMDRLQAERPDLFALIQTICIARRALRISEARDVLHVLNPEVTTTYDLIGDLRRTCQRLVKFGSEDTLELLHQTLYDFIINTYDVSLIHKSFAETCLDYLLAINWESWGDLRSQASRNLITSQNPFLNYASPWMGYHWRHSGSAGCSKAWDLWEFICSPAGRKWQQSVIPYPAAPPRSISPAESWISFRGRQRSRRDTRHSSRTHSQSMSRSPSAVTSEVTSANRDRWDQAGPSALIKLENESKQERSRDVSWTRCIERSVVPLRLQDRIPKPPLVLLAQWDVDGIIKELFFEAFESSPRQVMHKLLSLMPFVSSGSVRNTQAELRAMVNRVWEGTTAFHYAAAQCGRAVELLLPFAEDIDLPDDDGATPLNLAAASGEIVSVRALLNAGAEVDAVDHWNQTALYSAIDANSAEVVRALLDHGADPNIRARSGHSPLEVAIERDHLEFATILLEYSPDLRTPMSSGQPPAFLASRMDSTGVLEALIPHIDVDQHWDGERLIHRACWSGWDNVVKKLIRMRANLDDPPLETPKATPVALAAESNHLSILRALLAAGAAVECPFHRMSSPLHMATSRGYIEICKHLVRAGCDINAECENGKTALYMAADRGHEDIVELLVSHGADPNKPDFETPLHIAADWGNYSMVQTILSGRSFPRIDAKGERADTALGIAAGAGMVDILSTLINHGADPNLRSGRRTSNMPLQLAATERRERAMVELLRQGADPYPGLSEETSPFHTACESGFIDAIETFLDVANSVNELVNFEWGWYGTPLLQAALGGQPEVVQLLLDKGADPNYRLQSKINHGKTVIHAAAEGGNVKALEAILKAVEDPDLEVRDFKLRTPLFYACVEGREEMVEYLLEKGVSTDVVLTTGGNLTPGIIDGGSVKILNRVLERKPELDIDKPRSDGKTPLFFAVTLSLDEVVSILLERGADINRRSDNGSLPIFEAINYRAKESLRVLLENENIDLTQLDVYGRNALQVAQQAGRRGMPGMILGAAKDSAMEKLLMENRDMFGSSALDLTRLDVRHDPTLEDCIAAIRRDAHDLLNDFAPRGPRWERLGKFLLQLSAYSFAQVALKQSIEAVETSPLFLEHQVQCRLCLDLIRTIRYTCTSCCCMDLCLGCIRRYPWMGFRMWTCEDHSYYPINLPGKFFPPNLWPRRESDTLQPHPPRRLSLVEEESDEKDSELDIVDFEKEKLGEPGPPQDVVSGLEDTIPGSSSDMSESDPVMVYPSAMEPEPKSIGLFLGDKESRDDDSKLAEPEVLKEWVDRTEDQLREFLNDVLKIFTAGMTADNLAKWEFAAVAWKSEYDDRLQIKQVNNPLLLRPTLSWTPPEPYTNWYVWIVVYYFADVAHRLPLTDLFWPGYGRRAFKGMHNLRKVISKLIVPETRKGEVDQGTDRYRRA
ncbi:hypothetical protein FZEAL_10300 [Fusarium zealandicum]|uniref:Ankyrin n=1 Tax=Fusarium zealandicum TaxID=1053134 RepID=A0A8H4XCF5_9HYPO|nr:hypothetical protein FZEAL_10300 [Fusarium zealandicum]